MSALVDVGSANLCPGSSETAEHSAPVRALSDRRFKSCLGRQFIGLGAASVAPYPSHIRRGSPVDRAPSRRKALGEVAGLSPARGTNFVKGKAAMKRLYVVVRSDLRTGLKMAQACHAAREFTLERPVEDVGDNLVVLEAPLDELAELVARAAGVCSVTAFHEPDLDGALTAAAFGLGAQKLLSQLPLACRAA